MNIMLCLVKIVPSKREKIHSGVHMDRRIYIQCYFFMAVSIKPTHPPHDKCTFQRSFFFLLKQPELRNGSLSAQHAPLGNIGSPSCKLG